jgi:hypothetical protein
MSEDAVVSIVRRVRQERPDLFPDAVLAQRLDRLLSRADLGSETADEVVDLVATDERIRDEVQRRLSREDVRGVGADLPGRPDPTEAIWYECAHGEYRYPVFEVGEPVPHCPYGHGPLHRVS